MATLAALKRQIAKLEADVARVTKEEMAGAVAKVRKLMSDYGLTIEHLTGGAAKSASKKAAAKKPSTKKASAKRAGAGTPRYQDPKTGATWTGFGRAPNWLATSKSRDAFLIVKPAASVEAAAAPKKAASVEKAAKKAVAKAVKPARKATKTVAKKAAVVTKKAPAKTVTEKKRAATKSLAKKASAKKAPSKRPATTAVETVPQQASAS